MIMVIIMILMICFASCAVCLLRVSQLVGGPHSDVEGWSPRSPAVAYELAIMILSYALSLYVGALKPWRPGASAQDSAVEEASRVWLRGSPNLHGQPGFTV